MGEYSTSRPDRKSEAMITSAISYLFRGGCPSFQLQASPIMTPSPLNLNRTANASVYTLATVDERHDEENSPHAPLLTPLTPSYGSTMPRSPGTSRSSRKLILNATLKMAAIFVVSTAILGITLWLALPTLEE